MKRVGMAALCMGLWVGVAGIGRAQRPELVVQTGHTDFIKATAFSPDGRLVATASGDATIVLWDTATWRAYGVLVGHTGAVNSLAFSPDSRLLASGGFDTTVKLWDVRAVREIRTLTGSPGAVEAVAFSADGREVFGGSGHTHGDAGDAPMLRSWDVATGQPAASFPETDWVRALAVGPASARGLLASSVGETVKLWDLKRRTVVRTWKNDAIVGALAFRPDGALVATGDAASRVRLWKHDADAPLATFTGHTAEVACVAFSPDGQTLASGDFGIGPDDNVVRLWDTRTGKRLDGPVEASQPFAFSPDGGLLVGQRKGGPEIGVWETRSGRWLRPLNGYALRVNDLAASRDGRTLAGAYWDNSIRLWDLTTGRQTLTLAAGRPQDIHAMTLAFHPQGRQLASGNAAGELIFWDTVTGQPLHRADTMRWIRSVTYRADGKALASIDQDSRITLWDTATYARLRAFSAPARRPAVLGLRLAFSPDGRTLACADEINRNLLLFDAETGKVTRQWVQTDAVGALAFSPDGRVLAGGSNRLRQPSVVKLWDLTTGQEAGTLQEHAHFIDAVAFSPDGAWVASGSRDGAVILTDLHTRQSRRLAGHSRDVQALVFSADSKALASGGWDGAIKFWNVATGEEIANLVSVGQNDFVIADRQGYYTASRAGLRGVAFRVGDRAFPFEQFDLRLNRPDRVLQSLGKAAPETIEANHAAYRKRLQKNGFAEVTLGDDFHTPEVTLLSQDLPAATAQKTLSLQAQIRDTRYPLDRLNVYVNSVPLYGAQGESLRGKALTSLQREFRIELSPGNNEIQVSALNAQGVESFATVEIAYTPAAPAPKPDLYLIAVGVSAYRDSAYNLKYAAKDAGDLAAFFAGHPASFGRVHLLPITDQAATRDNILQQARNLLKQTQIDDEVILFFAGHGLLDEKLDYYFGAADMDFSRPAERGLAYDAIEGLLDGIAARKKLLLMDTCHSGEVDKDETAVVRNAAPAAPTGAPGAGRGEVTVQTFPRADPVRSVRHIGLQSSFALMQAQFADLRRGSGAVIISAASGEGYSLESTQWHNGVFTASVLEGLKTGKRKVGELRDFVLQRVQELTGGRQTPTVRQENLAFDFDVD